MNCILGILRVEGSMILYPFVSSQITFCCVFRVLISIMCNVDVAYDANIYVLQNPFACQIWFGYCLLQTVEYLVLICFLSFETIFISMFVMCA